MPFREGRRSPTHGRSAQHHALQISSTFVRASRSSHAYRKKEISVADIPMPYPQLTSNPSAVNKRSKQDEGSEVGLLCRPAHHHQLRLVMHLHAQCKTDLHETLIPDLDRLVASKYLPGTHLAVKYYLDTTLSRVGQADPGLARISSTHAGSNRALFGGGETRIMKSWSSMELRNRYIGRSAIQGYPSQISQGDACRQ
ncbi:hypothetical protein NXS19_001832 [Fusarium pseudograminearum]|nr:hypothetical protein NXS19_001832 [Fusarium pseudograminearum]